MVVRRERKQHLCAKQEIEQRIASYRLWNSAGELPCLESFVATYFPCLWMVSDVLFGFRRTRGPGQSAGGSPVCPARAERRREISGCQAARYVFTNYTESRPCEYTGSRLCTGCLGALYLWGINCKTCGKWHCTSCIRLLRGVPVCKECCRSIEREEKRKALFEQLGSSKRYRELWEAHVLVKQCMQSPSPALVHTLSARLSESAEQPPHGAGGEGSSDPSAALESMRKNLRLQMKRCVCLWYVHKTKEEAYAILTEQLLYLDRLLLDVGEEAAEPIHASIQELLHEISQLN